MGKGGIKNIIISVVWALIVLGVVLAVFQQLEVKTPEAAVAYIREKSAYYMECIPAGNCGLPKVVDDVVKPVVEGDESNEEIVQQLPDRTAEGFTLDGLLVSREEVSGPASGDPYVNNSGLVKKEVSLAMLSQIDKITDKDFKAKEVEYSRAEWKHWVGLEGRSCWNTREEVLYRDSVPGTIKLIDKSKGSTSDYSQACAIGEITEVDGVVSVNSENSGEWIDPYSKELFTDASELDIDHIIPLSNAAKHGGQEWTLEQKQKFANDLDNLLAVSASENRGKGDKGPAEYMPLQKSGYRCYYAKSYVTVAYKYNLTITESDYEVLLNTITSCEN